MAHHLLDVVDPDEAYSLAVYQEQALAAIKGLPPLISAYHPYYRSVERMRSQNRQ